MTTRTLQYHSDQRIIRKPKHLELIDTSDQFFFKLVRNDIKQPGNFFKAGENLTQKNNRFIDQQSQLTYYHDPSTGLWRKIECPADTDNKLQAPASQKSLKDFESVKADIINMKYQLNELEVRKEVQRIKCRAQEGGNVVDWGDVLDGLYDNDLKSKNCMVEAEYFQELKERERLSKKIDFKAFAQAKKLSLVEMRQILVEKIDTMTKRDVFEFKKTMLFKIQETFYRAMEANPGVFKCQTLLNLRRRRLKNVLGSENDQCWAIEFDEEKEDGGLGSGIRKVNLQNKYKEAQYVKLLAHFLSNLRSRSR